MWEVAEKALDIVRLIDIILYWRFYVCFLAGLLVAVLVLRLVPTDLGCVLAIAAGTVGFITGLVSDWPWRERLL